MERRSLHDEHNPNTTIDDTDIFDDEFEVENFDVADGFGTQDGASRSSEDEPPITSVAAHVAEHPVPPLEPSMLMGANRNSIRKSRGTDNPFSSAEDDDARSTLVRTSSQSSQSTVNYAPGMFMPQRSISSASSAAFARSHSPLPASTGPSHPYAMYPQGTTLGRTLSVSTTTSTIRPALRATPSVGGPSHPYSMYPQNVTENMEDDEDEHPQTLIPLGFPGRAPPFVRRAPAADEEQYIIGPDGHTEQLPAYSEYPEHGAPKNLAVPPVGVANNAIAGTALQLPLVQGLPQSMSDATNLPASIEDAALRSIQQMDSHDRTLSAGLSWSEKSWKEKRKTRFCGIPFWWILLGACVLAFVAIVLGATIGGLMDSQRKAELRGDGAIHSQEAMSTSVSSTLFDASLLPTTTSCTPLPTGTFALSLSAPQESQCACLTNSSEAAAWDCNLAIHPELAIIISALGGPNAPQSAQLFVDDTSSNISYGAQTPILGSTTFQMVTDLGSPTLGPAYHFQNFYDKVVVLNESTWASDATPPTKRDSSSSDTQQQQYAVPSSRPWFCFFNGTLLEGFIYLSANSTSTSSSAAMATSSAASATSPSPSSPITTSTAQSWSSSAWSWEPQTTSAPPPSKRQVDSDEWQALSPFNYVVKIEERRTLGSPQAYCQQMQILNNGETGIVTDGSGNPISFNLTESDPTFQAYQSAGLTRRKRAGDTVTGACHCQWTSGESN